MKMYLSSYNLGDSTDKLKDMVPTNNTLGYIGNALDSSVVDPVRKAARLEQNMKELNELGFDCFDLDLKKYFGQQDALRELIDTVGTIWVSGGNVFVLRQAFKLSGFDNILLSINKQDGFLYGGYSAGICILGPTLDGYHIVDDATEIPYEGWSEVLWDGLSIVDFVFLPHFESDHPESKAIGKELEYLKEKGLPYKTLRDGEVIVVE